MATPDYFGISDRVKRLTAPAGYEDVHQDGYSWARAGTTYEDTTRIGPDDWNQILANLRALLTIPGVAFGDTDPRTPFLLRDVITGFIGIKAAALLPGVLINHIPALTADADFMLALGAAFPEGEHSKVLAARLWATSGAVRGLSDIAGDTDALFGQVTNDPGTHTDPVTSVTVPNEGIYAWVSGSSVWTWLSPNRVTELESEIVTARGPYADLNTRLDNMLVMPALGVLVPYGFFHEATTTSTPTTVNRNVDGAYVHSGSGNTSFIGTVQLSPVARAELAAGRDVRLVVHRVAGSFSTAPNIDQPSSKAATVSGAYYTITLDAATFSTATFVRLRWTAAQDSVVLGPMMLTQGQVLAEPNTPVLKEIMRLWATEVADVSGNHVWGFNDGTIEDLSGAADLVGISAVSNFGRSLTVAGHARVIVSASCRGIVETGKYVTAVFRLKSAINDIRSLNLGMNSGFSGSEATASNISALARFGDLYINQNKVHLTDSYGDGRPVKMQVSADNRPAGTTAAAEVVQAEVDILAILVSDDPIPMHKFAGIAEIVRLTEQKWTSGALCDNTLAASAPEGHLFKTPIEAIKRGYGHIGLKAGQEYNRPGGFAMNYPYRLYTYGDYKTNGYALFGGWEELVPGDFSDNGDGTYSTTLTIPFQSGVAGDIVIERKLAGAFTFFRNRSSAAEVVADAIAVPKVLSNHYDTATKVLTINDNTAGSVYRHPSNNQQNFLDARCRLGRATGERRSIVERVDLRYAGNTTILHEERGVLGLRAARFGRAGYNGLTSNTGGFLEDEWWEPSIAEFVQNDGWSSLSTLANPVHWILRNSVARYIYGGDGFAPHGTWMEMDVLGEIFADQVGKMGFVSIGPGRYKINKFKAGANGLGGFGGGAFLMLTGASLCYLDVDRFEGDSFQVESGVVGLLRDALMVPKIGSGIGQAGINNASSNFAVQKPRTRLATASAIYDPPSLAAGASITTTVTVSGASQNGEVTKITFSNALSGLKLTGWISAPDTVTARFHNPTGGAVNLASGTLTVEVEQV